MNFETYHPISVVVDTQNDFCPGGSLAVTDGDQIVSPLNTINTNVRGKGGHVVFTRDWHPAVTTHFDAWPKHCVAGTNGAEFHPDLKVQTGDIIISKGTQVDEDAYSGFQGADQQGRNLETIVTSEIAKHERVVMLIGGLATDYCDKATVLDALTLQRKVGVKRLAVVVLSNCIKAVNINEQDGTNAIAEMKAAGAVFMESTEVQL